MNIKFFNTTILAAWLTVTVSCAYANDVQFKVKCHNGYFVGAKETETEVIAFKGIPFAKQPVGALRWKAPVELSGSNNVYEAKEFGAVPLQNIDEETLDLLNAPNGENCLNVNVWTADLTTKNKPVMFYIHGGAYGWEAARSEFYDMQFLVKDNPDIVVVSCDYRINSMGFFDLSKVPDGKVYKSADFKDSSYLGVLDTIAALKWVKKNIVAFGGDPNNITVFGESAGAGLTSILLVAKPAKGLFNRAIIQSGALNLTMSQKTIDTMNQTGALMEATGAKNMDDLMALTKEDILQAWLKDSGRMGAEGGTKIENLNNHPLRGGNSIIPEDPLAALVQGASKNVDVMIGTTADEWNYWIPLMPGKLSEKINHIDTINKIKEKGWLEKCNPDKQNLIDSYFKIARTKNDEWNERSEGFWKRMELVNEVAFRLPSIKLAESHITAKGKGKTYMYYFAKSSDLSDWAGSPHASELPYVFNNPKLGGTEIYGNTNLPLAKKISKAWTNFARTGNPSVDNFVWEEYDLNNRKTMVVNDDNVLKMVSDPLAAQRLILNELGLFFMQ